MERTFTQKVKSVPSCETDNDALEKLSLGKLPTGVAGSNISVTPEVNRRTRTSAAIIGLAISMGASSLLVHQQSDEAMAAEPLPAEPSTTVPTTEKVTVLPSLTTQPETINVLTTKAPQAPVALSPASGAIEQKANPNQLLWQLPQKEQVEGVVLSSAATKSIVSTPKPLPISSVNNTFTAKANVTTENLSKSYRTELGQQKNNSSELTAANADKLSESNEVPSNVNNIFKTKQDTALIQLKQQPLPNSQTELQPEDTKNNTEIGSEGLETQAKSVETTQPIVLPTPQAAAVPTVTVPSEAGSIPIKVIDSTSVQPKSVVELPVVVAPQQVKPTQQVINPIPTTVTPASSLPRTDAPLTVVPSASKLQAEPINASVPEIKIQVQKPNIVEPQPVTPELTYQIKPGDTLEAIAQKFGVSSQKLGQLNQLENPDFIRVAESIKIPQDTAFAANVKVSKINPPAIVKEATLPVIGKEVTPQKLPEPSLPKLSTPLAAPVVPSVVSTPLQVTEPQPVALVASAAIASDTVSNTGIEGVESKSTVLMANAIEPTTTAKTTVKTNSPYIDKLRGEILKLREQYRTQREGFQENIPVNTATPTVIPITSPSNNTATSPNYINPEFNPRPFNQKLQNTNPIQPKKRLSADAPIPIRVEAPPIATQYKQSSVVATAPTGTDAYNSTIQIPVGQPVSPELPSNQNPDISPDNPTQVKNFIWPSKGVLTSGYGWRWGRMHRGIDIAAPVGTPIVASASGVVVYARWNNGGYGNLVDIQHPDGSVTRYGHNSRILVREGQFVNQGEQIAEMGSTGRSTGPHCHFELHPAGRGAINPMAFLPPRSKK